MQDHNAHVLVYFDLLYQIAIEKHLHLAQFYYFTQLMREYDPNWSPYAVTKINTRLH